MPLLVLSAVIVLVVALTARQSIAYGVAGALGLLGLVEMVWAVSDDKGTDPWWLVLVGVAGIVVNLGIVTLTGRVRGTRTA
jgi:uncharacterized membrane protein HdeD (DUF308 family)